MPFIDLEAVRLHYRFDGPADAPVLVLSNSLGTDLSMWDGQILSFAKHFRVLRYDSRGHGASAAPPGPYSIKTLAEDVVRLLDRLAISKVHFCGLSMGGMVGMWFGTHASQRIHKLVLCSTAPQIAPAEIWDTRIQAVRTGGMAAIADGVLARWLTDSFRQRTPQKVEAVRQMLLRTSADGYVASCAAVRDMDQRSAISSVPVPTLVIAGTHDMATPPEQGRFVAEQIKGARYVELPAAHLSNIELAERFNEEVLQFLTE